MRVSRSTSRSRSAAPRRDGGRGEDVLEESARGGDTRPTGVGRGDEDGPPVHRVGYPLREARRDERVDRPRRGRVARADAVRERPEPERAVVGRDGEREALRRRERRVELAAVAPPRLPRERGVDTLERCGELRRLAHSRPAAGRTTRSRRGQTPGVTKRAMTVATSDANAATQNAVVKALSAGTSVPGIVFAVSTAAPELAADDAADGAHDRVHAGRHPRLGRPHRRDDQQRHRREGERHARRRERSCRGRSATGGRGGRRAGRSRPS